MSLPTDALSPGQLEIMEIIWERGEVAASATSNKVCDEVITKLIELSSPP